MAKKTNYIVYELDKLNIYIDQLQQYLDNNAPHLMEDRIERIPTSRGEILKVIASKETQLKCWTDRLKELPNLLAEVNKLRALVDDDGSKNVDKRGGGDLPGIFASKLLTNKEEDHHSDEVIESNENFDSSSESTEDDDSRWEEWEDE